MQNFLSPIRTALGSIGNITEQLWVILSTCIFLLVKECVTTCKERKGVMKSTKEFWSKKQFTDSSSMETWLLARRRIVGKLLAGTSCILGRRSDTVKLQALLRSKLPTGTCTCTTDPSLRTSGQSDTGVCHTCHLTNKYGLSVLRFVFPTSGCFMGRRGGGIAKLNAVGSSNNDFTRPPANTELSSVCSTSIF